MSNAVKDRFPSPLFSSLSRWGLRNCPSIVLITADKHPSGLSQGCRCSYKIPGRRERTRPLPHLVNMRFLNLIVASLCASAAYSQSLTIDVIEALLGGTSDFDVFLSFVEAIPASDITEFLSLITGNLTFAMPQSAPNGTVSSLLGDPSSIVPLLSYHLITTPIGNTTVAISPNHSIVPTALTDSSAVSLENNQSQSLVLTMESDGSIHILNQPTDVVLTPEGGFTLLSSTYAWASISELLVMPTTLSATLSNNNITTFANDAATAGIVNTLESLYGVTIFVPQDSAFSSAGSTISNLNSSELASVLNGHVINGTFYSPQLATGETKANFAGQTLTTTGSTVSIAGGNTANIVTSDVLLENGVVHIIDSVLILNSLKNSAGPSSTASSFSAGSWPWVSSLAIGCYLFM
ncbi:FAS1 domain-containing protein [Leucogyrophana mollusca]|uniref:FAS1 domain-containing protein n=1 Tax=Leucogyrophana mollusca TaxID=85980 RepID=A0ACB8B7X0_9AGAM|nr:FAS1 domain-containing protein [Leucogyrophana mollusca]